MMLNSRMVVQLSIGTQSNPAAVGWMCVCVCVCVCVSFSLNALVKRLDYCHLQSINTLSSGPAPLCLHD